MSVMDRSPAEAEDQLSWRATRLALIFMLDIVGTVRGAGHPIDPMILSVVSAANVSEIGKDARLEQSYSTLASAPPDALRRPITINAIASSAGMPFETVRRRVHRLAEAGLLEVTTRGVLQSQRAVTTEAFLREVNARYTRLRRFYFELKAADCLPDPPALNIADPPRHDAPPVRLANRAISAYALRVMEEVIGFTGHPVRGLMLLAVARASGEHLDAALYDENAPLADTARRPVLCAEIARRMRLPQETTRRHLTALVDAGVLHRARRGYAISAAGVDGPAGRASAQRSAQNLRRLFVRLAEGGVLAYWDAEAA
jgi:DNA-binding Lrp family transcriptional regulator